MTAQSVSKLNNEKTMCGPKYMHNERGPDTHSQILQSQNGSKAVLVRSLFRSTADTLVRGQRGVTRFVVSGLRTNDQLNRRWQLNQTKQCGQTVDLIVQSGARCFPGDHVKSTNQRKQEYEIREVRLQIDDASHDWLTVRSIKWSSRLADAVSSS